MPTTRPAAVAGMFYPADPNELLNMVKTLLANGKATDITPKAIIAPHAGFIYSGGVAASAYNSLKNCKEKFKRIVLLGPAHTQPVRAIAAPTQDFFSTPLGNVKLAADYIKSLSSNPAVDYNDVAHQKEHCLEVHLPFLQTLYPEADLIPLLVGHCVETIVADILEPYWNDEDAIIIVSSDLSHYHPYDDAVRIDKATTSAIESLDVNFISPKRACGCFPVRGLLELASRYNCHVTTIDQCNSGDTAGTKDRVVGYAAYAIY